MQFTLDQPLASPIQSWYPDDLFNRAANLGGTLVASEAGTLIRCTNLTAGVPLSEATRILSRNNWAVTVVARLDATNGDASRSFVFSAWSASFGTARFVINFDSSRRFGVVVSGTGAASTVVTNGPTCDLGRTYVGTFQRRNSNGNLFRWWVNGEVAAASIAPTTVANEPFALTPLIGQSADVDRQMQGAVGPIIIHDRVLEDANIVELHNALLVGGILEDSVYLDSLEQTLDPFTPEPPITTGGRRSRSRSRVAV